MQRHDLMYTHDELRFCLQFSFGPSFLEYPPWKLQQEFIKISVTSTRINFLQK